MTTAALAIHLSMSGKTRSRSDIMSRGKGFDLGNGAADEILNVSRDLAVLLVAPTPGHISLSHIAHGHHRQHISRRQLLLGILGKFWGRSGSSHLGWLPATMVVFCRSGGLLAGTCFLVLLPPRLTGHRGESVRIACFCGLRGISRAQRCGSRWLNFWLQCVSLEQMAISCQVRES